MKKIALTLSLLVASFSVMVAQSQDEVVEKIVKEANENSQLETLAHELMDVIGPRLVGTPQQEQAHNWAVDKFKSWGIEAQNEAWGKWRGWERGICHIDMVHPRVRTLVGRQLAWSASTPRGGVEAEVVVIPDVDDSVAFQAWLPTVKGKFVMVSQSQPTGYPDYTWEEYGTEESWEKMQELKSEAETQTSEDWEGGFRRWATQILDHQAEKPLLDQAMPRLERILIEVALRKSGGRKRDAADLLGWGRNTLTRKMQDLELDAG